jgi:hypothetical protein
MGASLHAITLPLKALHAALTAWLAFSVRIAESALNMGHVFTTVQYALAYRGGSA